MAKSIWKRGERMTRLEKKKLRAMMPHPNRGRALYAWRAEGAKIGRQLGNAVNKGIIDWTAIADKPVINAPHVSSLGTQSGSVVDEDCADDETYALAAYAKDDGPLSQEQLDWIYKNTAARPGEPITEDQMEQLRKSILSSTERLDLPPNTDISELYLESEPAYLEMVIGTFGEPNRNGTTFTMPKDELVKRLDAMVGKVVGEIGQNRLKGEDISRISKVDPTLSAGVLLSYEIKDTDHGFQVIGKIRPNPIVLDEMSISPKQGSFGIRALTSSETPDGKRDILQLISFDYLPPLER